MFKRFLNALRGQRPQGKAIPDLGTGGAWQVISGQANYVDANDVWKRFTDVELEDIYRTQSVVYSCIKKLCLSAVEAPLLIGEKQDDGAIKPLLDHPIVSLLERPNRDMSYAEFVWHFLAHLQMNGKSYVWKWRDGVGFPTELWPLPTSWVNPIRADDNRIVRYDVWQGNNKKPLPVKAEDMVRVCYPDPRNPGDGLGPLQAAAHDVQMDSERADYIVETLTNTRGAGTVVKAGTELSETQKDQLSRQINGGLGRGRRGRTLFLWGDVTAEPAKTMSDLDWPGLANLSESRICAVFGIPPILIGLRVGLEQSGGGLGGGNYDVARRAFYQDTMAPIWRLLDSAFTHNFLRLEGETDTKIVCYHDLSKVRSLQDDIDQQATRAKTLLAASIITINRARAIVGEPPLLLPNGQPDPNGELFMLPANMVLVPQSQLNSSATPSATPQDKGQTSWNEPGGGGGSAINTGGATDTPSEPGTEPTDGDNPNTTAPTNGDGPA